MWELLEYNINQLRNKLAHNIEVEDIEKHMDRMYEIAGAHIHIHAPGADPSEREANKIK